MAEQRMILKVDDDGVNTEALIEYLHFIKQDKNADWEGCSLGRYGGIAITVYVNVGDTIVKDDNGRFWIERA